MLSHEANHALPHAPAQGKLRRSAKFWPGQDRAAPRGPGRQGRRSCPASASIRGPSQPPVALKTTKDAARRATPPGVDSILAVAPDGRTFLSIQRRARSQPMTVCGRIEAPVPVVRARRPPSRTTVQADRDAEETLAPTRGLSVLGGRAPFHSYSAASSTTDKGGSDEDRRRPRRRPRRSRRRASASPRSRGRTRRWRPPTPASARPGGGRAGAPPARPGDLGATFARTSPARRGRRRRSARPRSCGSPDSGSPASRSPCRPTPGRRRSPP